MPVLSIVRTWTPIDNKPMRVKTPVWRLKTYDVETYGIRGREIGPYPKTLAKLLAHPAWKGSIVVSNVVEGVAFEPWATFKLEWIHGKYRKVHGCSPGATRRVYVIQHPGGTSCRWWCEP